jgi:hypothetical protein
MKTSTATSIVPLLRPDALDDLAENYELAAAVSLAGSVQTRDWPQTVHDLVTIAFCLRFVARRLREGPL